MDTDLEEQISKLTRVTHNGLVYDRVKYVIFSSCTFTINKEATQANLDTDELDWAQIPQKIVVPTRVLALCLETGEIPEVLPYRRDYMVR